MSKETKVEEHEKMGSDSSMREEVVVKNMFTNAASATGQYRCTEMRRQA